MQAETPTAQRVFFTKGNSQSLPMDGQRFTQDEIEYWMECEISKVRYVAGRGSFGFLIRRKADAPARTPVNALISAKVCEIVVGNALYVAEKSVMHLL